MLVVLEVQPGVYGRNAQVARIYGISRGPSIPRRHLSGGSRFVCDLLLVCYPRLGEVDGKDTRYPSETLEECRKSQDGPEISLLNSLALPRPDVLMDWLAKISSPPLDRLEAITDRLERTSVAAQETVTKSKYLVDLLSHRTPLATHRTHMH